MQPVRSAVIAWTKGRGGLQLVHYIPVYANAMDVEWGDRAWHPGEDISDVLGTFRSSIFAITEGDPGTIKQRNLSHPETDNNAKE